MRLRWKSGNLTFLIYSAQALQTAHHLTAPPTLTATAATCPWGRERRAENHEWTRQQVPRKLPLPEALPGLGGGLLGRKEAGKASRSWRSWEGTVFLRTTWISPLVMNVGPHPPRKPLCQTQAWPPHPDGAADRELQGLKSPLLRRNPPSPLHWGGAAGERTRRSRLLRSSLPTSPAARSLLRRTPGTRPEGPCERGIRGGGLRGTWRRTRRRSRGSCSSRTRQSHLAPRQRGESASWLKRPKPTW